MSAKFVSLDQSLNSSPLHLSEAIPMIRKYHCHPNKLETRSNGNVETLKGLILEESDLTKIEELRSNGINKFLILFAIDHNSALSATPTIKQSFTTILAPIKVEDGLEVIDKSNLINKFLPCPDKCSHSIQESYNNLFFGGVDPTEDCREL